MTLLIGCLLLPVSGCGPGPALSELDSAALNALMPYHPTYQLDNDGRIISLKLEGKKNLGPQVLKAVGQLSELRNLSLYGSSATDGDLAELTKLQRLQQIGLGGTGISDAGLDQLKKVRCLQRVWLPRNGRITPAQVEDLHRVLPGLIVTWQ
jgi:hypothetical protein